VGKVPLGWGHKHPREVPGGAALESLMAPARQRARSRSRPSLSKKMGVIALVLGASRFALPVGLSCFGFRER